MTVHDKEKALFLKRYNLGEQVSVIIHVAFNEGWLRGRKQLRDQQTRARHRRRAAK
jgi:hypothetical protein